MEKKRIFISSVQKEFAKERHLLCNYIRQDALLGKYFVPFIFEELPATNQSARQSYLSEVQNSNIYLGIVGIKYGFTDIEGISPTEREFDEATKLNKYRICFIKTLADKIKREEKEEIFVQKIENKLIRKSFQDYETLRSNVYAALIRYLEEKELLRLLPFDASYHPEATIEDIDDKKIDNFIRIARRIRNFPLQIGTPIIDVLKHLNLLNAENRVKNAAILLFGKHPQRFFITSEIKCAQFYGDEVTKPIPSYQVYQGDLFELITQAVDFVASRINARVGTRKNSAQAPVHFELPLESIREAIVNAVAHRDYTSKGSIQVMLFRNRLEIWNPGQLPTGITIEQLYQVHESFPNNPLIANPLYLAGYAERLGTGTADITKQCLAIGLKPPSFSQTDNFRTIFWRNVETLNENSATLNENAVTLNENSVTLNENSETLRPNLETLRPNLETSSIDIEDVTKYPLKTLRPNLETLKPNLETLRDNLETLEPLQGLPKRMSREALEEIILTLCSEEYLTVNQISRLIGKSSAYLLNEIIPYLTDNQRLIRLFPATPKHKNQAYKTNQV
jgi:predicted HTH transcriptional regulator